MLKHITNPFTQPTVEELRKKTLDDYERQLMAQEAAASYHRKLVEYYRDGITRLKTQQTA